MLSLEIFFLLSCFGLRPPPPPPIFFRPLFRRLLPRLPLLIRAAAAAGLVGASRRKGLDHRTGAEEFRTFRILFTLPFAFYFISKFLEKKTGAQGARGGRRASRRDERRPKRGYRSPVTLIWEVYCCAARSSTARRHFVRDYVLFEFKLNSVVHKEKFYKKISVDLIAQTTSSPFLIIDN